MRIALSMGMHRAAASLNTLTPVEKESRRRTWWVLYFFDRFSASKLGQPIMIRDDDIDVEFPSMDGLNEDEKAEFLDPTPLMTNTKLARIIGNIRKSGYGSKRCASRADTCGSDGYIWHTEKNQRPLHPPRSWHPEATPGMA